MLSKSTNILMRDSTDHTRPTTGNADAPHDIRDLLTFRIGLLAATNERIGHAWMTRDVGVKIMEWRVLGIVAALGPVAFRDIVAELRIDKGQLSRLLSGLVTRGLVDVKTSPEDKRVKVLTLTEEGQAMHDRILPEAYRRNQTMIEGALEPEEVTQLFRLLDRLQPFMDRRAAGLTQSGKGGAETG